MGDEDCWPILNASDLIPLSWTVGKTSPEISMYLLNGELIFFAQCRSKLAQPPPGIFNVIHDNRCQEVVDSRRTSTMRSQTKC